MHHLRNGVACTVSMEQRPVNCLYTAACVSISAVFAKADVNGRRTPHTSAGNRKLMGRNPAFKYLTLTNLPEGLILCKLVFLRRHIRVRIA